MSTRNGFEERIAIEGMPEIMAVLGRRMSLNCSDTVQRVLGCMERLRDSDQKGKFEEAFERALGQEAGDE